MTDFLEFEFAAARVVPLSAAIGTELHVAFAPFAGKNAVGKNVFTSGNRCLPSAMARKDVWPATGYSDDYYSTAEILSAGLTSAASLCSLERLMGFWPVFCFFPAFSHTGFPGPLYISSNEPFLSICRTIR